MGSPVRIDWGSITRRESDVLEALRERPTNAEIAAQLFISERTVESHVSSLLRKLGATSRLELASLAALRPAPDRRLPGPLELLVDPEGFAGRDDELARLLDLWDTARSGSLRLAVLAGEAGIGKSRLAAEMGAAARADGAIVLWGACYEDAGMPYQPLALALADELARTSVGLGTLSGDRAFRAALGILDPAGTSTAGLVDVDLGSARVEIAMALVRWLSARSTIAPVLLVLEDLHWATRSTLEVILNVARMAGDARAMLLTSTRDVAPDLDDDLNDFLGRTARLPNVDRITLDGLDGPSVARLLELLSSDADAEIVRAETDGNPLLVRELAAAETGAVASLPNLLASRERRLDEDDREVLDVASVLGAAFDARLAAAVTDRPLLEVIRSLERAEQAGLVAATPAQPGQFAFAHGLFRSIRYEALPGSRRLELHHAVAIALGALDDHRTVVDLARHACLAVPLVPPRTAIAHACRAAEVATSSLDLDEAVHQYRQALLVADLHEPDPALRMRLQTELGGTLIRAGDGSGRTVLLEAATAARRVGTATDLAEIAWAMARYGTTTTPGAPDAELASIAADALEGLGPTATPARARVLAILAGNDAVGGDPVRGMRHLEKALEIARQLDDPATLGQVLLVHRYAGGTPPGPDLRQSTGEELIRIGRQTGDPTFMSFGLATAAWAHRERGDLDTHDRLLDEMEAELDRHPIAYGKLLLTVYRGNSHVLRGQLDAAEEHAQITWQLASESGFDGTVWASPLMLTVLKARGGLAGVLPLIEDWIDVHPGFKAAFESVHAVALCHGGREPEARAILDRHTATAFADVLPNLTLTTTLSAFCEAAELTGHQAAAALLRDRLAPYQGLLADNGAAVSASVDLGLVQAARASGAEDLVDRAQQAVDRSRQRDTPVILGRELVRLAAALHRSNASRRTLAPLVEEFLAIADATGARIINWEAERFQLV